MSRTPSTSERNPSDNLICPYCQAELPPKARFCSSCGKQISNKESRKRNQRTEKSVQDQDATIRLSSLSKEHLQRWEMARSRKNAAVAEQLQKDSAQSQEKAVMNSSSVEAEIPESSSDNTVTQHETVSLDRSAQPLPTLPVTPPPQARQRIPVTEVPASQLPERAWVWPVIITVSAIAAGLVNFVFTGIVIRPIIVLWFLAICPGMIPVRFLRLKELLVELLLASALSFAIDALVAGILLYTGKWSSTAILSILIGFCLAGAIVLAALAYQPQVRHTGKRRFLLPLVSMPKVTASDLTNAVKKWHSSSIWRTGMILVFIAILAGMGVALAFRSGIPGHSAAVQPPVVTSHPTRPASIHVSTTFPSIVGTYGGTVYDLSLNASTVLSLTIDQQHQEKISGYLILSSRPQESDHFNGTIDTAKRLQFTLTDSSSHVTYLFKGVMQTATSFSGNYYQCNPTQNGQCGQIPGSYGIWYASRK